MRDEIETTRLRLSACMLSDADEFHGLCSDPLTHTIGTGPFRSRAETVDWLERRLKTKREYGFVWYGIRHREGGPLIGGCGILAGRTGAVEPEIGYEIKHSERGSGLALEAAHAVVSELRATTTVTRLWATVRPRNAASLRICERLGLVLDHVETDKRGELLYLVRNLACRSAGLRGPSWTVPYCNPKCNQRRPSGRGRGTKPRPDDLPRPCTPRRS